MDIKNIIARAAYIEERLDQEEIFSAVNEQSEEKLQAWERLLNVTPGKKIFEMRLESSGITRKEALSLCGNTALSPNGKLPAWAEILEGIVSLLPTEKDRLWGMSSLKKEDAPLVGPTAAFLPFLLYAEERLKAESQGIPRKDLSGILLHRLYHLCSATFHTQAKRMIFMGQGSAQNPESLWAQLEDNLLGGGWVPLFEEYPVLAKRIGITIEYYISFFEEFLDRYSHRKHRIETHFFAGAPIHKIERIEGEISDLHQGGKSVLILSLDGNRKIVYKPRTMEIDVAWKEFLTYFTTEKSRIKAPNALDFGNYGFMEFIQDQQCETKEELRTYFYNAGSLMALLYAFGGNDFHMENIIAAGATPVIIDTETLMTPSARFFGKGGKDDPEESKQGDTLEEIFEESVIKMGFLPMWQKGEDSKRADYGALTGNGTDMKNLPVYKGQKYNGSEFPSEICEGFRQMYRLILLRREELLTGSTGLALFKHCKFRILIRNSQVYGNLLLHITQPSLLRNGFDYSMKTDRLLNAFLYHAHESIIGELIKVFLSEKRAIERGDIPIFYGEANGEGILDEGGMLFDRYFEKSAIANARAKISKFNENDLMIQLQIIEKSLATELRSVHEYLSEPENTGKDSENQLLGEEELLEEAKGIYSEMMSNRLVSKNGDYSWLSEQYDLANAGTSLSIMGPALYDGLLGISVFSAALYALTKEHAYFETAEHCMKKTHEYVDAILPNMERYQINLGYSSGISGYLAGLSLTSEYLKNEDGYQIADKLIVQITEKMIQEDKIFDVLGGISGLVLSLTREESWLKSPKRDTRVMVLLRWCGEHLLDNQSFTGKGGFKLWKSKEASQPLTGLGHGASGIGLALFRLYEVFGEERFLDAAKEALAYEDSVYDQETRNWPDFRADSGEKVQAAKKFMAGYCAGAPGIGLARLDALKRIQKDNELAMALRRDIQRADHFIRSMRNEGRNHLCCGSAGRIDFLIEEGLNLGDAEARLLAHRKLSDLVSEKRKRGHYNFHTVNGRYYYNPTLFQGTGGIGYEILRFLAPEKIPSVLI